MWKPDSRQDVGHFWCEPAMDWPRKRALPEGVMAYDDILAASIAVIAWSKDFLRRMLI